MNDPSIYCPQYSYIEQGCSQIVNNITIKGIHIDRIIGVSRGGLIPSVIISHLLKLPLTPIIYSSPNGKGETKDPNIHLPDFTTPVASGTGELPSPQSLLIVDDISDSGETLKFLSEHYTTKGNYILTAVLYYKRHQCPTKFIPDFFWNEIPVDSKWVKFPWEPE